MHDPTRIGSDCPIYSKDNLPGEFDAPGGGTWASFRKKTETRAVRIEGPFEVDTTEGVLKCENGWLAVDARGYPYPIAADEFDLIYEPVASE